MKTLIAKAQLHSEWDSVDFALIDLNPEFVKLIKDASKEAKRLNKKFSHAFMNIRIQGDNAEWFIEASDINSPSDEIMELLGDEEFVIVKKEFETETLQRPEQDARYGQMKVDEENVQFLSYGKHTDEEFWTEPIPVNKL